MIEDIYVQIINYIRINRVSTTEIADCMGKKGAMDGVLPLNRGHFSVGRVKYFFAVGESNWNIHKDLEESSVGRIIFIDAIDVNNRAVIGDIVSKYALLYQGGAAIVTNGRVRDAHTLIKENYPIWCIGVSPIGCFNKEVDCSMFQNEIDRKRRYYEHSIAVCDDSGVVIIPPEEVNSGFLDKIVEIENQEDIWYDCIDRQKWSTFKTVCRKEYLDGKE